MTHDYIRGVAMLRPDLELYVIVGWGRLFRMPRRANDNCLIYGLREKAMRRHYCDMIDYPDRTVLRPGAGSSAPLPAQRQLPEGNSHASESDDNVRTTLGDFSDSASPLFPSGGEGPPSPPANPSGGPTSFTNEATP